MRDGGERSRLRCGDLIAIEPIGDCAELPQLHTERGFGVRDCVYGKFRRGYTDFRAVFANRECGCGQFFTRGKRIRLKLCGCEILVRRAEDMVFAFVHQNESRRAALHKFRGGDAGVQRVRIRAQRHERRRNRFKLDSPRDSRADGLCFLFRNRECREVYEQHRYRQRECPCDSVRAVAANSDFLHFDQLRFLD